MEKYKFKVGDWVIGNKEANDYGITVEGWIGQVTSVYSDSFDAKGIDDGNSFHLDYDRFDLYNPSEWVLDTNLIENKEKNMKILDIYEERKEKILHKNYNEKIKEFESFDSIQSLIEETEYQLNALLCRKDDDKVTISVNNLHGDKLHDEITQVKIEEAGLEYDKQNFELKSLIEEVEAILEMTSDYEEQIKILKKYKILDKEGKLNV